MKIRIVDIATKAGVSVGTVDRIIHQRGKVSETAKEKVQMAIKELGYEPDLLARNLALKKELHIICLLPDPNETVYWQRPNAGLESAIKELSAFKVTVERIFFHPRVDSFREAARMALEKQPSGVIYVPMFFDESLRLSQALHQRQIPFIHINIHHPEAQPLAFVGQNPLAAGQVAARLCQMAVKEQQEILITYVYKQQQDYSHQHERIDSFVEHFTTNPSTSTRIHHLHLNISTDEKAHEQQLIDFLDQHSNIHIIYIPNSRAYRIASILKKHQRKKLIIGFDTLNKNVHYLKQGHIDILIGQQSKTQGYKAVMHLFNLLFKKEEVVRDHYLPIDILTCENIDYYEGLIL
jgi:LacI family transcriptional regulator